MSETLPTAPVEVPETTLAAWLQAPEMEMHRGAKTPLRFAGKVRELQALLHGVGVFDLGYRAFLQASGRDRVRWLNGMVTQAVKSMTPEQIAYTLVLNPQGRIQGDAEVYCCEESLLLETDRSQAERLLAHLRRFIIMDQVTLDPLGDSMTAIGVAGPKAAGTLQKLGVSVPEAGRFANGTIAGADVTVAHGDSPVAPRFEIHVAAAEAQPVWDALTRHGAEPCGVEALDDLRVLEGVPACDVDFSDRHLPQEANLQRALNFTKGCYIGQEIVERIRARATVHRSLRRFALEGETPNLRNGDKRELRSGGAVVGELTSAAEIATDSGVQKLALGMARAEALDKNEPLEYDGGTARPLAASPNL